MLYEMLGSSGLNFSTGGPLLENLLVLFHFTPLASVTQPCTQLTLAAALTLFTTLCQLQSLWKRAQRFTWRSKQQSARLLDRRSPRCLGPTSAATPVTLSQGYYQKLHEQTHHSTFIYTMCSILGSIYHIEESHIVSGFIRCYVTSGWSSFSYTSVNPSRSPCIQSAPRTKKL